jgi:2-keto-3-deoxy-L-fuconate dehydrogenase
MGPAITRRFRREGADVIENCASYEADPMLPTRIVTEAGKIDILVVNLRSRPMTRTIGTEPDTGLSKRVLAYEEQEEAWQLMFNRLVHPTRRFISAVLPQMIERRSGKIIAITSAVPMRSVEGTSTYSTARAAQNAYVRVAGAEVAKFNVQINAIAQNFVKGGFAHNAMDIPAIRDRVMAEVPAQRLSEEDEQAELALFLATESSNFFVGQVIPYAGGWV